MIGKSISGTDKCHVCGNVLNWEKIQDGRPGQVIAYTPPEINADACAVGKNEDGTVRFEITCTCPRCRSKNKFYKDVNVN